MEVEACEPANEKMKEVLDSMSQYGVKYLYGRWLVEGSPYVLLFDTGSVLNKLDEWKGDLWRSAGIPSPPHDTETNDAILFGYLVTWFLGELTPKVNIIVTFVEMYIYIHRMCNVEFYFSRDGEQERSEIWMIRVENEREQQGKKCTHTKQCYSPSCSTTSLETQLLSVISTNG